MADKVVRFLLVEDNSHVREILTFGLLRGAPKCWPDLKVEVLTAENGQEALELIENNEIDVLISDLYLPVMDGKVLIRRLRASPRPRISRSWPSAPAR